MQGCGASSKYGRGSSRPPRSIVMRKALATIATGPAADLLALTFPTFLEYAARHGYDLIVGHDGEHDRSAAWGRVPLLQKLLQTYEFVVWLDADLVILDTKPDIECVMP